MKTLKTLAILLSVLSAAASAEIITGNEINKDRNAVSVNYFSSSNDFTLTTTTGNKEVESDVSNDSSGFNIIYTNQNRSFNTYFGYQYESFDEGIYDLDNNALHSIVVGMEKQFPITQEFSFDLRSVFSTGFMTIDNTIYNSSIAAALGLKAGVGVSYEFAKGFGVQLGADYQYRYWTPVEILFNGNKVTEIERADTGVIISLGIKKSF